MPHDRPDRLDTVQAYGFLTGVKFAHDAAHAQLRREADLARRLARGDQGVAPAPTVGRMWTRLAAALVWAGLRRHPVAVP